MNSGHGGIFSDQTSTENPCGLEITGFDFSGQTNSKTDLKVDSTFFGKTLIIKNPAPQERPRVRGALDHQWTSEIFLVSWIEYELLLWV